MSPTDLQRRALAAVGVAVLTWGCSNVMIKAVPVNGFVASFYRLWFSIPLLWLLPLAQRRTRRIFRREWVRGSLLGGSLFALHQVLFFNALKLTTVANVALIGALQPLLVLSVAGPWFGERIARRSLPWAALALTGVVAVVLGAGGLPAWSIGGDLLAVGNLMAFTGYFLASKRIRRGNDAIDYLIGMTTVAGVIMLAICLASGQPLSSPRGGQWLVLLTLALIPGTLGHFLINWAHAHTSAFVVSILMLGVPVVACAGAALWLDERLSPLQIGGAAVALAATAALLATQPRRRAEDMAHSAAATDAP
jgi:drug/metabolite transporter (DMT)-like permease